MLSAKLINIVLCRDVKFRLVRGFRVIASIFDPMWLCPFGQPEVVAVPIITIFRSTLMPGKMDMLVYILLLCDGAVLIVWFMKPSYLYLAECILWFRLLKTPFCGFKSMCFRVIQLNCFLPFVFLLSELNSAPENSLHKSLFSEFEFVWRWRYPQTNNFGWVGIWSTHF